MRASPPKAVSTVEVTQPSLSLQPQTLETCGHPTCELSFCNVTYPVRFHGDSEWLQYTDNLARNYFEEYRQSGASSTCLAATKSLVCSRYFPRCTPSTLRDGYTTLLPCQSICTWLHDYECPGAEQSNCSLTGCPAEYDGRNERCFSVGACTAYQTLARDFASPPPALALPPSPSPPPPPMPRVSVKISSPRHHSSASPSPFPSPEPSPAAPYVSARRTPEAISQELARLVRRIKLSSGSHAEHAGVESAAATEVEEPSASRR